MASSSTNNAAIGSATDMAPAATGPCQVCQTPSTLQCSSSVFYCSTEHQKQDWKKHKADGGCSPLQKAQDDHYGRYWIASRNIKAGELILKELPVIVSPMPPNENRMDICVSCCTELLPPESKLPEATQDPHPGAKLVKAIQKSCRKCGWPVCGEDCEKAPIHADNECPLFASRFIRFPVLPPTPTETGPRLDNVHMYHSGIRLIRGLQLKGNDLPTWNKIMELQDGNKRAKFAKSSWEKETILNIERRHSIITTAIRQEFKVADLAPEEDWLRLHRIFETNGYAVARHEIGNHLESRMIGLYLEGSLFNHSCTPNAFRNISYAPAFELHIRAATDIKKGEMITLSYYPEAELYGTDERLAKLMFASGFACQCARCLDPTELGTYSSAIICDRCPEKGIMLPTTFQNPEEPYSCQTPGCKNTKTRSSVSKQICTYHREICEDGSAHCFSTDITKLEEFVARLSGKILHPNHWLLRKAERGCLSAYNDSKDLAQFVLYGQRWVEFSGVISPGICPQRAEVQLKIVQAMVWDVKEQERKLSRKEAYDRWAEIFKWASDSLKYWRIDVELTPPTPPGNENSQQEKVLQEIMIMATAKLLELR